MHATINRDLLIYIPFHCRFRLPKAPSSSLLWPVDDNTTEYSARLSHSKGFLHEYSKDACMSESTEFSGFGFQALLACRLRRLRALRGLRFCVGCRVG